MYRCIFCNRILSEHTKPEHIIPCSLGGRKKSTTIVCSGIEGCNEYFGNGPDKKLAEDFIWIRNELHILGCNGQAPPIIKSIESEHGLIDILPGGIPKRAKPIMPKFGEKGIAQRVVTTNIDESGSVLAHYLRSIGINPFIESSEKLKFAKVRSEQLFFDNPVSIPISVGGTEQMQGIAKIAIELFSTIYREQGDDPRLVEIKNFARYGIGKHSIDWDPSTQFPFPFSFEEVGLVFHAVSIWSPLSGGPLIATVVLFSNFIWTIELTSKWWKQPFSYTHVIDPLKGRIVGDRFSEPISDLAIDWKNARGMNVKSLSSSINITRLICIRFQYERLKERLFREAKAEVTEQLRAADDQSLLSDPEHQEMIYKLFNKKLSQYERKEPFSREVDHNKIHAAIRMESEKLRKKFQ